MIAINWFKRLRARTVFNQFNMNAPDNEILAVLFHRTAASLYLIYTLWAIAALINKIPTIVQAQGEYGSSIFAVFLLLTAAPAAVGATFFPRLGRLEMYSEATFSTIVLVYEAILIWSWFTGVSAAAAAQAIVVLSLIVVPVARGAFIFITLIKRAGKRVE